MKNRRDDVDAYAYGDNHNEPPRYRSEQSVDDVVMEETEVHHRKECNDVFFLLVWLAMVVMVVVFASAYGDKFVQATQIQSVTESTGFKVLFQSVVYSALVSMAMSLVWIVIMLFCGKVLIWVALIGLILMNIAAAYFLTKYSHDHGYALAYWPAVVFGLGALLIILYACCIRRRISFAAAHLKVAGIAVFQLPMTLVVALVIVLVHAGWAAAWVVGTAGVLFDKDYIKLSDICSVDSCNVTMATGKVLGITFGLLIVFFWGSIVLKNIVAVTVAGTVAAWKNASNAPFITVMAWVRAMTLNLGSICFGSLIVAILEAIRTMLNILASMANRTGSCVGACVFSCLSCIIGCIESWVEFFNRFAYTYVGIYGYSFVTASKHVWKLFAAKGWTAIVNDNLTGIVFFLGNVVVGALAAFLAIQHVESIDNARVAMFDHPDVIVGFFGFFVGYATNNLFMSVIASAVTTVFVLWAEDPHGWQMTRPDAYEDLHNAWEKVYPEQYNHGYGKQREDVDRV